jgi:hypothetical protein
MGDILAGKPVPSGPPSGAREDLDLNRLGDALSGKADPYTTVVLLWRVHGSLEWLTWRTNWLKAHVNSLRHEAACRDAGMSSDQASRTTKEAVGVTRNVIEIMEANRATPPRILDEARARLKRLVEADAGRPPPR